MFYVFQENSSPDIPGLPGGSTEEVHSGRGLGAQKAG